MHDVTLRRGNDALSEFRALLVPDQLLVLLSVVPALNRSALGAARCLRLLQPSTSSSFRRRLRHLIPSLTPEERMELFRLSVAAVPSAVLRRRAVRPRSRLLLLPAAMLLLIVSFLPSWELLAPTGFINLSKGFRRFCTSTYLPLTLTTSELPATSYVFALLRRMTSLRTLTLRISPDDVTSLLRARHLSVVSNVLYALRVNDVALGALQPLLVRSKGLRHLALHGHVIDVDAIPQTVLTSLHSLTLTSTIALPSTLQQLVARSAQLRSIAITHSADFEPALLADISATITALDLSACACVSNAALGVIGARFRHLQRLRVAYCISVTDVGKFLRHRLRRRH